MSNLVVQTEEKLNEYGFDIIQSYDVEDQYCFSTDEMNIFVDDETKTLSIAFEASSRPEDVARTTLILNEIEDLTFIYIMDSYCDFGDQVITGDDAHKYLEDSIKIQSVKDYARDQAYKEILSNVKCHSC